MYNMHCERRLFQLEWKYITPKLKTLIDKNKLIEGLTEVDKIMGLKNLLPLLIQIIENQETYS
jgi:hypothetical protein